MRVLLFGQRFMRGESVSETKGRDLGSEVRAGGILGGVLGTSFVYMHGSKLGAREAAVDRNLVILTGRKIGVAVLDQEYVIWYGKEPVEVRGGGTGTATIMEFWNL